MSSDEFNQVKAAVLAALGYQHTALDPDEVVRRVGDQTHRSDDDVRRAIWYLVARDQVHVTPDWQLQSRSA